MLNDDFQSMKDYFLRLFMKTGLIEAYLAYKELERQEND